jgi:nucleoside-diphosphate-sugar epimerase
MKSAFVTGATGFVGLNLVDELVRQGWEVTALHRVQSDLADLGRFPVTLMPGDITDPASLRAAIPESVDVVFHVAGNTNMWSRRNAEQTRENVEGTRNVVVAARARGAKKLVFTSSIAAYGQQTGELIETTKSNAEKSWINYQRTKWLAEEEVRSGIRGDFPATILNPGAIIGPHDTSGWARLFHLVAENRLPGVPPGELSAAHVREVAKAHVAAAERGANGENYILAGTATSFVEMLAIIAELLGKPPPKRVLSPRLMRVIARLQVMRAAITGRPPRLTPESVALSTRKVSCPSLKAQKELGFKVVPIKSMLQDCFDWLMSAGKLKTNSSRPSS